MCAFTLRLLVFRFSSQTRAERQRSRSPTPFPRLYLCVYIYFDYSCTVYSNQYMHAAVHNILILFFDGGMRAVHAHAAVKTDRAKEDARELQRVPKMCAVDDFGGRRGARSAPRRRAGHPEKTGPVAVRLYENVIAVCAGTVGSVVSFHASGRAVLRPCHLYCTSGRPSSLLRFRTTTACHQSSTSSLARTSILSPTLKSGAAAGGVICTSAARWRDFPAAGIAGSAADGPTAQGRKLARNLEFGTTACHVAVRSLPLRSRRLPLVLCFFRYSVYTENV